MATLRDIKRRINAVNSTAKITQAMKMVATAKLKRAQDAIISARPFAAKLGDVLSHLVSEIGESYSHPLLETRKEINNIALILIAADRGLCGSFNTNIFRHTSNYINDKIKKDYPEAKVHLITIGKRASSAYNNPDVEIAQKYPKLLSELTFDNARHVVNFVSEAFIDGKYDKVVIIYNLFKNLLVQKPSDMTLLPIESHEKETNSTKFNLDYIFEPSEKEILDELLPRHLDIQFWRTVLESNAAEHAARRMAMENATKNAHDLSEYLEMVYNKERQAAITTEMLDIVGGANAL